MINFLNQKNEADKRVLELLTEKFQLFNGVFGVSDEILGKIESGIDFEKRILAIYDTCRTPKAIQEGFAQLQKELETAINERIRQTQQQLLEHFDEEIHDLLKLKLDQARQRLSKISRWFWLLTQHQLRQQAEFDATEHHFRLQHSPLAKAPTGQYKLVRSEQKGGTKADEQTHVYRLSHPLGEWVVEQGLQQLTPLASDDGESVEDETCRKLFTVAASAQPLNAGAPDALAQMQERRIEAQLSKSMETNQQYFHAERDKLERWADDKILASEEALEDTKTKIKTLKRESRQADSLEQQQILQKQLRDLERQQRRQRQAIFDVEDAIIERRDTLIDELEKRLKQQIQVENLFTVRWSVT